ncbi:MAG TPA: hypothetical protein VJ755_03515 [Gemmatimonadales bacterium]|nr:hypothetical protein [Gemmatimonadales bacterium]
MKTWLILLATLMTRVVAAQTPDSTVNPRARLFTARRCAECHGLEALKVKAAAEVGPDLSAAYADVPARYGVSLERFLAEPAGFMRSVLSEHKLTRTDADSLVRLFHDVYMEHLGRLDSLQRKPRPVRESGPSKEERP